MKKKIKSAANKLRSMLPSDVVSIDKIGPSSGSNPSIKLTGQFKFNIADMMNKRIAHATFTDGPHPFPLSITVPQDIEDRDKIIADLTAATSVNWFGVPCKLALESVEGDMVNLMASPIDTGT